MNESMQAKKQGTKQKSIKNYKQKWQNGRIQNMETKVTRKKGRMYVQESLQKTWQSNEQNLAREGLRQ